MRLYAENLVLKSIALQLLLAPRCHASVGCEAKADFFDFALWKQSNTSFPHCSPRGSPHSVYLFFIWRHRLCFDFPSVSVDVPMFSNVSLIMFEALRKYLQKHFVFNSIWFDFVPFNFIPSLFYPILSGPVLPYPLLSYLNSIVFYSILLRSVLFCSVLSCPVLFYSSVFWFEPVAYRILPVQPVACRHEFRKQLLGLLLG